MLQITIPARDDLWDEANGEFVTSKEQKLVLEHSLVSLSTEETIDYIRCMTLTQNVDPKVYNFLTDENIRDVNAYIEAPMTATWFSNSNTGKQNQEQITAELVYYWMIALNIPFECQKWHLNRLLTLIRVCEVKNSPPKKMSKREILSRNAALNAARRKQLNSKG